ncbi:FtsK/SpoIIIE domain-containing protein [Paenibacillus lautus]|uniref:FtsK/SpoIIIE domain-containing protein n=1 Tax=Paenibacillus lautus TaxID=1401 RepID=UPI003D2D5D52
MDETNPKKESFSMYVTRITGFAALISLGGLFFGLPFQLEELARILLKYAVFTWIVIVGVPQTFKYVWNHRQKIKDRTGEMLHKGKTVVESASVPVVGTIVAGIKDIGSESIKADKERLKNSGMALPATLITLPENPRPLPTKSLTEETAGTIIMNAIQLSGLRMEEPPEILGIDSGPTLQKVSFRLSNKLQLTDLAKKREDLANHIGHHQGFLVEASSHASAAAFVVPHKKRAFVYMRDVVQDLVAFGLHAELPILLGKDMQGKTMILDLATLPHLLVAGTTGSGKSVGINTFLTSLMSLRTPEEVKFLLIDPKMVEFHMYNGMPHLISPPVTDPKRASSALRKLVVEMEKRYEKMSKAGVRNIKQYNRNHANSKMAYLVAVIDEYADLTMVAGEEVEDTVMRLGQMGRAAGIHIIMGTQRPSVNVVTGPMKANLPSRIAFQLPSSHDYRTVMDTGGPDLLGGGDGVVMLKGGNQIRFQSAAISADDDEMNEFIEHLKKYWQQERKFTPKPATNPVTQSNHEDVSENQDDDSPQIFEESEGQLSLRVEESRPTILDPDEEVKNDYSTDIPSRNDDWEFSDSGDEDEPDEYGRFVEVIKKQGGFNMAIVDKYYPMDLTRASKHVERMVREGLLSGEFDHNLRMKPWIGDRDKQDDVDRTLNDMKVYICRTRTTRSDEIREVLRMRKETVLSNMKLLVEEGFLNPPVSSRSGYTIAWDEDQIQEYLENSEEV